MKRFIKDNILEKYKDNESKMRLKDDEKEEDKEYKYEKQKQELENKTKNQINKIIELDNILRVNDLSIIEYFFSDLYIYFLSNKFSEIPDYIIEYLDIIIQISMQLYWLR